MSGTRTKYYTLEVRGSYLLNVKVPKVAEVQRMTSPVLDGSSLGGSCTELWSYGFNSDTGFDFTTNELKLR